MKVFGCKNTSRFSRDLRSAFVGSFWINTWKSVFKKSSRENKLCGVKVRVAGRRVGVRVGGGTARVAAIVLVKRLFGKQQ